MVRVGGPRLRFGSGIIRVTLTGQPLGIMMSTFHLAANNTEMGYQNVDMEYSLNVVVLAVHISPAGVAQVQAPVRGLLITRVQVELVFLVAAFADFGSRSCLLLLHMQVTSCGSCMQCAPIRGQSCGAVLGHPHALL